MSLITTPYEVSLWRNELSSQNPKGSNNLIQPIKTLIESPTTTNWQIIVDNIVLDLTKYIKDSCLFYSNNEGELKINLSQNNFIKIKIRNYKRTEKRFNFILKYNFPQDDFINSIKESFNKKEVQGFKGFDYFIKKGSWVTWANFNQGNEEDNFYFTGLMSIASEFQKGVYSKSIFDRRYLPLSQDLKIPPSISYTFGADRRIFGLESNCEILFRPFLITYSNKNISKETFYLEGGSSQIKEKKFQIIGSNEMDSKFKIFNPNLKRKINGEKIFTFTIYTKIFDEEIGEFKKNPLINELENEVILKVKQIKNNKIYWHEFIIKDKKENSIQKTITYTAKERFIEELSKQGFNLEFDKELGNNQGTIKELGSQILENTNWTFDIENTDKMWASENEVLYEAKLFNTSKLQIEQIRKYNPLTLKYEDPTSEKRNFEGKTIYIPYSIYQKLLKEEKDEENFQFLFLDDQTKAQFNDKKIIYNMSSYVVFNLTLSNLKEVQLKYEFKGEKLSLRKKSFYYAPIKKVVTQNVLTDKDSNKITAYSFETLEKNIKDTSSNLIISGEHPTSLSGWKQFIGRQDLLLKKEIIDNKQAFLGEINFISDSVSNSKYTIEKEGPLKLLIRNDGLKSNVVLIDSITKGDQYDLFINYYFTNSKKGTFKCGFFERNINDTNEILIPVSNIVSFKESSDTKAVFKFSESLSTEDIKNRNLYFYIYSTEEIDLKIKEISLFNSNCVPLTEETDGSSLVELKKVIKYFIPPAEEEERDFSLEKVKYLDIKEYSKVEEEYYPPYEAIRSITIKESNYFNIIQELCEAFQCWANFNIQHDALGNIIFKKISFKKTKGERKSYGFTYGLNLKGISRTINSDKEVSKLIVKVNNNELAKNGHCTIQIAKDNFLHNTEIYNFDYFFNSDTISSSIKEELRKDLYAQNGLLQIVRDNNLLIQKKNDIIKEKEIEELHLKSEVASLKEFVEEAENEIAILKNQIVQVTGESFEKVKNNFLKDYNYTLQIKSWFISEQNLELLLEEKKDKLFISESSLRVCKYELAKARAGQEGLTEERNSYFSEFEKKYSIYIKEGTWISENYYDENLYYTDALNVSAESAYPKISYSIDVIDVAPLGEEYKYLNFELGDKTYVEDSDFYGVLDNSFKKVPYYQEVVISEISEFLDSPEKNKIVVQNFKTQFQDLFQRISATTQSLQYHEGSYWNASNKFLSDGSLKADILQKTLTESSIVFSNNSGGNIVWNSEGIYLTNLKTPNERIRLSSTGIYLSLDNGEHWSSAITAKGINIDKLKAGVIDAGKINILSKSERGKIVIDGEGIKATLDDIPKFNLDLRNGNATFAGELKAASGTFAGGLIAASGTLGNLTISENGYIESSNYSDIKNTGWKISNNEAIFNDATFRGTLEAVNGTLGNLTIAETGSLQSSNFNKENNKGWKIDNNQAILNEAIFRGKLEAASGTFAGSLEAASGTFAGDLSAANGTLGSLTIAENGHIESSNYTGINGWRIDNNGAVFNDVSIRGSLKAATFEAGEINTVGGQLLVRPSTKIKKVSNNQTVVEVEDITGFNVGAICLISRNNFLENISEEVIKNSLVKIQLIEKTTEGNRVVFSKRETVHINIGDTLINLSDLINGTVGISINASEQDFLFPEHSLTVFESKIGEDEKQEPINWTRYPHVILGELPERVLTTNSKGEDEVLPLAEGGTYGLYADNVHLTGTINATGGKIGNMTIEEVNNIPESIPELPYEVKLFSSKGNFLTTDEATQTLTALVYKGNEIQPVGDFSYEWEKKTFDKNGNWPQESSGDIDFGWTPIEPTGAPNVYFISRTDVNRKAQFRCRVVKI